MSEIKQFKRGDKIRVTYEAEFAEADHVVGHRVYDSAGGYKHSVPPDATVELIEPADDPKVGELRREDHDNGHSIWQWFQDRHNTLYWLCVSSTAPGNRGEQLGAAESARGWPVIGVVPGTPAAEPQVPDPSNFRRRPWVGDGSEEPPAHVNRLKWSEFNSQRNSTPYVKRADDGLWFWSRVPSASTRACGAWSLARLAEEYGGTFTEVIDR